MAIRLIDPADGGPLLLGESAGSDGEGRTIYPVVSGIPRICGPENYSANFGLQWNAFPATQIDRADGLSHSRVRFFKETAWTPRGLDGLDILEVGSGAGRFSEVVLAETRARLWSADLSSAVEANRQTNAAFGEDRFNLFQASIYELPFPDNSFDKVFCLGVLQHTPDFRRSVEALVAKAKAGGEVVVDFYPITGWWTKINAKYLLRPFTRRMSHERLLDLIERNSDRLIGAYRALEKAGLRPLTRFLPVCDISGTLPDGLSRRELREWVILDTFDQYSPEYDNPQRIAAVARMFEDAGCKVTFADFVEIGDKGRAAVVRGIKQ